MNLKYLALTASIAVGAVLGSSAFTPAHAYRLFFGEDQGANSGFGSIANSQAAEANFLSNLTGVGTETFESFPNGANPSSINFGAAGTANISSITGRVQTGANGVGRFPISGTNYYEVGSGTFTVNFSNPIAAFGFYGTDIGDFAGRITLALSGGGNTTLTVPNTINGADGSALYYGLLAENSAETFTSITFGNTNVGTDFFGFDNLTIGTLAQVTPPSQVPEPFTIIGTLVGGTAAFRMRKRFKQLDK